MPLTTTLLNPANQRAHHSPVTGGVKALKSGEVATA
jgi:hypothetical protein